MTSKFDSLNNEFNVDGDIVQSEIVNEKIQKIEKTSELVVRYQSRSSSMT